MGRLGQHYHIIDESAKNREVMAQTCECSVDDIESWAVCDRDNLKDNFTKLRRYASDRKINLAFSDPQFENYLLQHFGSSNDSRQKGSAVERELTALLNEHNIMTTHDKADLKWLEDMIDQKPRLVYEAVKHADCYHSHTKQPFFTVQRLTERILALSANALK